MQTGMERIPRSPLETIATLATVGALFALLLLPFLKESSSGGGVIPVPVGSPSEHQFNNSSVPLIQGRSVTGASFITDARYGGEDEPYGKFLWAEVAIAAAALGAALALSIPRATWARGARILLLVVALAALMVLPPTLRQTVHNNYEALRFGFQIALVATLAGVIASILATAFGTRTAALSA